MLINRWIIAFACAFFLLVVVEAVHAVEEDWTVIMEWRSDNSSQRPKIFRVEANGRTKPINLPTDGLSGGRIHGHKNPLLSPNRQIIAFTKRFDIWLRDIRSGKDTQLTDVGQSGEGHIDFGVSTIAWSPDSKRLLVFGTVGYDSTFGNMRQLEYGYHDCEIGKKSCRQIPSLANLLFQGWTYDDDYIATTRNVLSHVKRVSAGNPRSKPEILLPVFDEYPLVSVSDDGRWLIAFEAERKIWGWKDTILSLFREPEVPIEMPVLLNLVTGERKVVPGTPDRKWVDSSNRLRLSPSGKHVAYIGQIKSGGTIGVVVDGRLLPIEIGDIIWINDHVLVVYRIGDISVVDIDSNKILGRFAY
jgi:WD40 repeat protein